MITVEEITSKTYDLYWQYYYEHGGVKPDTCILSNDLYQIVKKAYEKSTGIQVNDGKQRFLGMRLKVDYWAEATVKVCRYLEYCFGRDGE